jgi:uncharacterized protein (TIGR02246 family)
VSWKRNIVVATIDTTVFGEKIMRMPYVLCFLIAAISVPAAAADFKHEAEKLGVAYAEAFSKQDPAGIAKLYADGGMLVNATGSHADIAQFYAAVFKAGFNHDDITVDQASSLGADTAIGQGEYRITGKNDSGAPVEAGGLWTAVYVLEGGNWKVKMLSAFPKAQPPK